MIYVHGLAAPLIIARVPHFEFIHMPRSDC
jgi:hypothetical protein